MNGDGWTISIDAASDIDATHDEIDQLVVLFRPYGGAIAVAPGRLGVTFSIYADKVPVQSSSLERVADFGAQLFRELLSEAGRDDWTLVRLDVATFVEHDATGDG